MESGQTCHLQRPWLSWRWQRWGQVPFLSQAAGALAPGEWGCVCPGPQMPPRPIRGLCFLPTLLWGETKWPLVGATVSSLSLEVAGSWPCVPSAGTTLLMHSLLSGFCDILSGCLGRCLGRWLGLHVLCGLDPCHHLQLWPWALGTGHRHEEWKAVSRRGVGTVSALW